MLKLASVVDVDGLSPSSGLESLGVGRLGRQCGGGVTEKQEASDSADERDWGDHVCCWLSKHICQRSVSRDLQYVNWR